MANKTQCSFLLASLLVLGLLLAIANEGVAARSAPNNPKTVDKKQPEYLVDPHDGTVLIPGFGRVIVPKPHGHGHGHPSYKNYNPITGTYAPPKHIGSHGIGGHIGGMSDRPRRSYIPGADDTFIPNPGFEVPIPGRSGVPTTGSGTGNP
ncbi:putative cell wall protein [Humulus lupulus]|uniref:putative cell wall protein n=1 Tax=Humulus lupulus TaxID=3486 RepID=UPI002B40EB00|nr:putative cell wall protein [Humulus lupulus]